MDLTDLDKFPDSGLIKTNDTPNKTLTSAQKVELNRRGNTLFNAGDIEAARRIFQATGYSDGLSRVGNEYYKNGKAIDALKMFKLSHEDNKSSELIERAAQAIQKMLNEEVKE